MGLSVFPIKPGAKFPALVKWGTQSSDDPAQVKAWARRWPDCNWGMDCEKSGLAVVDVDIKDGKVGQATLDHLEEEYGKLPATRMSRTWSGGVHYIFKGVIPSTASKMGKDVDTRGKGGMVLIPGSVIEGHPYEWINNLPFAPLPDWVANLAGLPPAAVQAKGSSLDKSYGGWTGKSPALAFAGLTQEKKVESLAEGLEREEMPPLDYGPLVKECAFFRDALKSGGKEYSQPMWNLTTLMATFLESGHALAHKMGREHAEYTSESTEVLWVRKLRERKDRGLGWPSCNAIQASGCTACAACPHLAAGKSPLNFTVPRLRDAGGEGGGVQAVEKPLILKMPRTFLRRHDYDNVFVVAKLLPIKEVKNAGSKVDPPVHL